MFICVVLDPRELASSNGRTAATTKTNETFVAVISFPYVSEKSRIEQLVITELEKGDASSGCPLARKPDAR